MDDAQDAADGSQPDAAHVLEPKGRSWVKVLIRVAVAALLVVLAVAVIRAVDWGEVWEAMRGLEPWHYLVLVLLVVVRQVFNAAPLAVFVPGLGFGRATVNDTSAAVVATVAPPPSDLVIRFAMFRAWGMDLVASASGLTLNTILFYVLRFAAPVFGVVAFLAANRFDETIALVALSSGIAAVVVAGAMMLVARSERGAAWIGRTAGRLAAKARPEQVEPQVWEEKMRGFRSQVQGQLSRGWIPASLFLIAMLAVEALQFLAALRFVGLPSSAVSAMIIIGAFCVTYLMTALPVGGLGFLDVALYGLLIAEAGSEYEAVIIAGIIIWRVTSMLIPLIIGGLMLLTFRRRNPEAEEQAAMAMDTPDE